MALLTVLGVPAAVYVVSIIAMMFQLNGEQQDIMLLVGSGLLTAAIYVFHRSSINPIESMQPRHRLAYEHNTSLQVMAFVLLVAALVVFALHHPLATLLAIGSLVGVILYGRNTLTKPLRTVIYLKPFAVGVAIALFGWALVGMTSSLVALLAMAFICSVDALVCDLVDREFDVASGCTTLAKKLNRKATWGIALLVYIFAAGGMLYFQMHANVGWLLLIVFPLPLLFGNNVLRTLVDIRPTLALMLAWAL